MLESSFSSVKISRFVPFSTFGRIGPVLVRLEERGLVRHKGKYWTIGEDDRLASYAAMAHTFATVEERFPDEEMDEWLEHAENPYDDEHSEDA